MVGIITSILTNGGLGILGSIATKATTAVVNFKTKDKEMQLKKLEYEALAEERKFEKELLEMKLKYQQQLTELNNQELEQERQTKKEIELIRQETQETQTEEELGKRAWGNFYLPPTSKSWVDVYNAMVRPTVALLMVLALTGVFAMLTYRALTGDITQYETIMEGGIMTKILYLCENIITFYFGARSLNKK